MEKTTEIPTHVAIIMDGNGRWAESNGYDRSYGHLMGVESVKDVIDESLHTGVKYLTLYAFSLENWSRPEAEIEYLMELFCSTIVEQKEILKSRGVRVHFMGATSQLSAKVQGYVSICEQETAENDKLVLVIALNYSSRNELVNAVKQIALDVELGVLSVDEINEETVKNNLYIASLPDPDLIIRTSGECRLSNFMLWQASYSEFYFTDVLWPDFKREEFSEAINSFTKRQRRYGNI